jgi:dTDP-glucose 4,6-dehydratase
MYEFNNILVTGGAGFIGCHFIRQLLANKQKLKVINLDLLTHGGSLDNLRDVEHNPHYHFIKGDITDRILIDKILREYHIDTIVHFAAESHVDRSITTPESFVHTNVMGTFTLLDAARVYWLSEKKLNEHQCRFHHISTDEVYGTLNSTDPAFTETMPYAPNSPYSASKAGSDHLVRAYFHTYHLPVTTSNCSNNYGPYQHDEKFIPTIIRSCLTGKNIPVYGKGNNIRDWLYVEDHCRAIETIINSGKLGETYNIGGLNEVKNIDIVNQLCELLDQLAPKAQSSKNQISFVTDRPGHDFRYAIDNSKIARELHWKPLETFESGLMKTVEFYIKKYTSPLVGEVERSEGED